MKLTSPNPHPNPCFLRFCPNQHRVRQQTTRSSPCTLTPRNYSNQPLLNPLTLPHHFLPTLALAPLCLTDPAASPCGPAWHGPSLGNCNKLSFSGSCFLICWPHQMECHQSEKQLFQGYSLPCKCLSLSPPPVPPTPSIRGIQNISAPKYSEVLGDGGDANVRGLGARIST